MKYGKSKQTGMLLAAAPVLLTGCVNHVENGEYVSTGSIMAGAFANLVIGMGTVFAVLIFLTWIISLFRHVHKLEEMFGDKKGGNGSKKQGAAGKANASKAQAAGKPAAGTAALRSAGTVNVSDKAAAPSAGAFAAAGSTPVVTGISPAPADGELTAVIAAAVAAYEADTAAVTAQTGTDIYSTGAGLFAGQGGSLPSGRGTPRGIGFAGKTTAGTAQTALQNGIKVRPYRRG